MGVVESLVAILVIFVHSFCISHGILSPVRLSPGAMARLSLLALVVLIANCSGSTLRIERDACDQLQEEVTTCTMNAYKEYQSHMLAGEDGRPDWFARKACNYLTATVEDCYGKLIGDCNTEKDVNDMRDQAIPGVLEQLSENVEEWDSEKCPVVKNHFDRVKEETEEEEKEEEEAEEIQTGEASEDSADNSENENPDDTETNGEEEVQDTTTGENVEEESTETGNGEKGEDEGPESGTEAAVASLSLVLVGYIMCSA